MKQRAQIVMSDAEVDAFLSSQRSSTVGTLGPSGQIHLVGMWFAWFDGHLWFETKLKSQKVVNLRRDPRMSSGSAWTCSSAITVPTRPSCGPSST